MATPTGSTCYTASANGYQDYALEKPLKANSFVSITLAWDRLVELKVVEQVSIETIRQSLADSSLNCITV